jgi:MFS transporter, DHA2 family, multidrug resistance protein
MLSPPPLSRSGPAVTRAALPRRRVRYRRAMADRIAAPSRPTPPADDASPFDRPALAAVLMAVALVTLDSTITSTALPRIAADLRAPPAASIWVVNAYQLAVVAALLPFAALGDRLGARRVHLGGMLFFIVASIGSALADSLATLAAARAMQGIGAAATMSVNIALIRQIYPAARLGRGVGLNALVVGASFAAGPTVASLLMAVAPWPWLYVLNLPLGALAFAVAWSALPRRAPRGGPYDALAALLAAVTFAAAIGALAAATQRKPLAWVLTATLLALGCGAALLRRQAGHATPMLPVDLLRRPLFALSIATALASFAAQGLAFVSLPFFFENVLRRSPVQTGFLMAPWAVVVAAAAPLAGRLSERYPPGLMGGIGLVMLSAGLASLAQLGPDASAGAIVARMALCGAGFGLFQSPNLNALMSAAPPERSGSASGMVAMARLNGQALGSALVALCFGLAGARGPTWALALGAGFAAVAALASAARLWVR